MSPEIGPLPPVGPPSSPRPAAAPAAAPAPPPVDTVQLSLPVYPPREVLEEVDAAAGRAADLAAANRELHFRVDEDTGRVVVEVRDLEGHVIRTIPPSHALEVMAGASL